ncbi:MAG: hypothetical protein NT069_17685 [Planctomycetota bacterium]|nr:hypothetical protein [Planctomycetota bacterium]
MLGCSDARVPTETVFDQWFNDLFVLRIAGNVLGSECLGSLHYAVKHFWDIRRAARFRRRSIRTWLPRTSRISPTPTRSVRWWIRFRSRSGVRPKR